MPNSDEIVGAVDKYLGPSLGNAARSLQSITNRIRGIKSLPSAQVNVITNRRNTVKADTRVKILIPDEYINSLLSFSYDIAVLKGIIFPYTPNIIYDTRAEYGAQSPTHSNYTQHFYKNSSIGDIRITGKFTVQNNNDAINLLATQSMLRILTKMRTGNDDFSGAPPPVCRLKAYGNRMLDDVPIVIKSFTLDLPEMTDYYTLNKTSGTIRETASVPVLSTISLICSPVYSRQEIQDFSVNGWLANGRINGYL
jgi:hypothetical protein